jgi:hypothetical protein
MKKSTVASTVIFSHREQLLIRVSLKKGEHQVYSSGPCAKKLQCTVMLYVIVDGRKLLSYLMSERKTIPKGKFHSGIHSRAQEKGWMLSELMTDQYYVRQGRCPCYLLHHRSIFVLDSFHRHLMVLILGVCILLRV